MNVGVLVEVDSQKRPSGCGVLCSSHPHSQVQLILKFFISSSSSSHLQSDGRDENHGRGENHVRGG